MSFVSKVEALMARYSFPRWGFARVERPLSMDFYRAWIEGGLHGQMAYLSEHLETRENPRHHYRMAHGALVIARPYLPHPYPTEGAPRSRVALYARGEDYHLRFKEELRAVAEALAADFPGEEFLPHTDTAPILERDLAYRAGLGWFGKNSCLIHPAGGSLFLLGEILTSRPLDNADPVPDMCGTCDRCLRACPTGALEAPRRLNATKCISYWTVEAAGDAPEGLRAKIGDWLFGCDICQTVCPWNEKLHGRARMAAETEAQAPVVEELRWILTRTNRQLARAFARSPLSRARPNGLKRNALVVIGARRVRELETEVQAYLQDPRLNQIARWTLSQLR